jgi:hypothetical protein
MRFKWLITLPLVLGLLIFVFSPSRAAASLPVQNISITPAIILKNLNAGQDNTGTLTIGNNGRQGYGFSISAASYGVQYGNYQPVFKTLPGYANITSWFSFSPATGFLPPGGNVTVNYSIDIPSNTSPGGYYAAVLAQTNKNTAATDKTAIRIEQRVGSIFYLTVNGKVYEKGSINKWGASLLQSSPVGANLSLKDSGKLYYIAKVNVYFEDILGGVKYQFTTQKIVLPKVVRDIPVAWPNPPVIGLYKVRGNVTIYGLKQLPTRYILVVSTKARIIILIALIALLSLLGSQNIYQNIVKKKPKKSKIKK